MKTLALIAVLFASAPVMADITPAVCINMANQAAQILDLKYSDGAFNVVNNPSSASFKTDFKTYAITQQKSLGNCELVETQKTPLPKPFCQGNESPEVFELQVSKHSSNGNTPLATVVVTYDRSECVIDSIVRL